MVNLSVSIILPTYNHAHLLYGCLDNILAQTFQNYEILIIDDGSTDVTRQTVEKFKEIKQLQDKIYYIYQKHSGVSKARNTGIINASNNLIAFIDDDDRWDRRKLELQLKAMNQDKEIALSYTNLFLVYENSGHKILQSKRMKMVDGYIFEVLLDKCFIITSSVIALKDVLLDVGLFDETINVCEDWDLWLRVAYKYKIGYIPEPLLYYSMHTDNAHKNITEMVKGHRRIIQKIFYADDFIEYRKLRISAKLNFYLTAAEAYVRRKAYVKTFKNLFFALLFIRPKYLLSLRRFCGVCFRCFFPEK